MGGPPSARIGKRPQSKCIVPGGGAGDGVLVKLFSVVDAVLCAVEIQRGMTELNAEVADEKRIKFRIGINVGATIRDANDIYGKAVNVAARLEGLAQPGGILVLRNVYDQVRDKRIHPGREPSNSS